VLDLDGNGEIGLDLSAMAALLDSPRLASG